MTIPTTRTTFLISSVQEKMVQLISIDSGYYQYESISLSMLPRDVCEEVINGTVDYLKVDWGVVQQGRFTVTQMDNWEMVTEEEQNAPGFTEVFNLPTGV